MDTITQEGAFTRQTKAIINDNFDEVAADIAALSASTAGGTLTSAHLLVGNSSNVATDRAITGDVTIGNTGVTAIKASVSLTTPVLGVATGTSLAASGLITSSSPSAGIGYATGAGGTGTQGTDKTTTVTLSPSACLSGAVTTNNAQLNAGVVVSFSVTDSVIAATDVIVVNHLSGGTLGSYTVNAHAAAGSFSVNLRNNTAGNLSEALVLQFAVIKAVNA